MWKFVLGPILLGAASLAGSIYGADAQQLVRKPPSMVRTAVGQAVANAGDRTIQLEGGKPLDIDLQLEWISDEQMLLNIEMNGKPGAETHLSFTPQDDGKATLVTAKVEADGAVLRETLAGTSKEKLGYAPDWLFNLTIRPVLREFAAQVEQGGAVGDPLQGFQSRAKWEAQLPPEKKRELQKWRQYDAARPRVDPNGAARDYLKGQSGN